MDARLVHNSNRGVQNTSFRYIGGLGEISAIRSVDRKDDSYNDAAADVQYMPPKGYAHNYYRTRKVW
jgi:hypothetical protein